MATATAETAERETQFVTFALGEETHAIDIHATREILRLQAITPLPRTTPEIAGVINLRGRIVPVVSLRARLGLPAGETTAATRIVVVETAQGTVGLLVDSVSGVVRLPVSGITPPTEAWRGAQTNFAQGMSRLDDTLVIVLDIHRLLNRETA